MPALAVILAAGLGTRMRSARPKALHPIAGRPMLRHLIESCAGVFDQLLVVVGPGHGGAGRGRGAVSRPSCSSSDWAPRTRPCRRSTGSAGDRGGGALRRQPAGAAGNPARAAGTAPGRRCRAGPARDAPRRSGPLRPGDRTRRLCQPHRRVDRCHRSRARRRSVQCRRVLRRGTRHGPLAARRAAGQRQGRILPDRRGRPRGRRGRSRCGAGGAGRGTARHQFPCRARRRGGGRAGAPARGGAGRRG